MGVHVQTPVNRVLSSNPPPPQYRKGSLAFIQLCMSVLMSDSVKCVRSVSPPPPPPRREAGRQADTSRHTHTHPYTHMCLNVPRVHHSIARLSHDGALCCCLRVSWTYVPAPRRLFASATPRAIAQRYTCTRCAVCRPQQGAYAPCTVPCEAWKEVIEVTALTGRGLCGRYTCYAVSKVSRATCCTCTRGAKISPFDSEEIAGAVTCRLTSVPPDHDSHVPHDTYQAPCQQHRVNCAPECVYRVCHHHTLVWLVCRRSHWQRKQYSVVIRLPCPPFRVVEREKKKK